MSRAYSADLRERVLAAVAAGQSARGAAARFGIGPATAIRWVHRWRETGERTARKPGHPPGSKLDAHAPYLLGLVATHVDLTLAEIQRSLTRERGVRAALGTLWGFYRKQGLTYKKRLAMRTSRAGPPYKPPGRPGPRASRRWIPHG